MPVGLRQATTAQLPWRETVGDPSLLPFNSKPLPVLAAAPAANPPLQWSVVVYFDRLARHRRIARRLGKNLRSAPVLEADRRFTPRLHRFDEVFQFAAISLRIAIDEEMEQRSCLIGRVSCRSPDAGLAQVFRRDHSL